MNKTVMGLLALMFAVLPLGPAAADPGEEEDPPSSQESQGADRADCGWPLTCDPPTPADAVADLVHDAVQQMPDSLVRVQPVSLVAGVNGVATGAFGCVAVANAGAVQVRILSCTSGPDAANTVVVPGNVAATAWVHTDTSNTALIRSVCYHAIAEFADGSDATDVGCSSAVVLLP
jgi:hypothetical protein